MSSTFTPASLAACIFLLSYHRASLLDSRWEHYRIIFLVVMEGLSQNLASHRRSKPSTFTPVFTKASWAACMFLLRSSCFAEISSCFAARFSLRVPSHYLLYALSLSSVVCRNTQLPELFSIIFLSCLYINFACKHHIFNTIFSLRFVTYLCLPPSGARMFVTVWTAVWTHIYFSAHLLYAVSLSSVV